MTLAAQVLTRIRNNEVFDSDYTKIPTHEFGIMNVDDSRLFEDLSQEERLKFSDNGNYPMLNIFANIYLFVTDLNLWVLVHRHNTWNACDSYNHKFLTLERDDKNYLLDVEQKKLYVPYRKEGV